MLLTFRRSFALLLLSLLAACGGTVAGSMGSPPGPVASDAGTIPMDAGGPTFACGTLSVTGPVQPVSDPGPSSSDLFASVSAGPNGVLVGWLDIGHPLNVNMLRLRRLGFDGSPASPGVDVLPANTASWISVAQGFGRAAALATDPKVSCRFVPLDASGSPSGASTLVGAGPCAWLEATESGYTALANDPQTSVSLLTLDAKGALLSSAPLGLEPPKGNPLSVPIGSMKRTTLRDGSFLLAWEPQLLSDCVCPTSLYVEHFSATGQALAPARLVASVPPAPRFALAAMGDGALFTWEAWGAPGPLIAPIDRDGNATAPPMTIPLDASHTAMDLDMTALSDGVAIVTWRDATVVQGGVTSSQIMAQAVSGTAAFLSLPVVAASPAKGGTSLRVVSTPAGALVVFDASFSVYSTALQTRAVPLGCAP